MVEQRVVVCGLDDAHRASTFAAVRECWPGPATPRFEPQSPNALISLLEDAARPPTAVLAFLKPEMGPSMIDRLVDALLAQNVPAVCILEGCGDRQNFHREGVIFQPPQTPAAVLAGIMFALTERQGAVQSLTRELSLAMRCQSGFRLEIDRLHEEMHMAAAVQRELLPATLPEVSGLDFGLIFRPVNYVSGDIYDVQQLSPDHVGFFLADAVGHGVPAALLTMILTYSLDPIERGLSPSIVQPSEVMRRLNDRLCHSRAGSGRFATAVYGLIDMTTNKLRLAGAGHPPPLIMARNGHRAIETDGPLLGVFADAEFPQVEVDLNPGETLVLYTDGLECAFPSDDAPVKRLHTATKRYMEHFERLTSGESDSSPRAIMEKLTTLLDSQAGSLHQSDDVTALAIAPALVPCEARLAA